MLSPHLKRVRRIPTWKSLELRSLTLLVTLLILILTTPLTKSEGALASPLGLVYTVLFCFSGYLLAPSRRWLFWYGGMVALAVIFGVTHSVMPRFYWLALARDSFLLGLQVLLVGTVLQYSLLNPKANKLDRILAGICGYLILGLLWANLYAMMELIHPGSFAFTNNGTEEPRDGDLFYFSFVTLSTLGYGDVLPTNIFARILSSMEAVAGTLYLAVFISSLVGGAGGRFRRGKPVR